MSIVAQIAADIDLALTDFGESQTWTPAGGAATPFTGIADTGFAEIPTAGGGVLSSDMRVTGKKSVIGSAKKGDAVTYTDAINSITAQSCIVAWPESPSELYGPGMVTLHLKKA